MDWRLIRLSRSRHESVELTRFRGHFIVGVDTPEGSPRCQSTERRIRGSSGRKPSASCGSPAGPSSRGASRDEGDYIVSGRTFDRELKPELERGYEVKLPREGEEFAFLQRGWQETYVTHRGQMKRVVVGASGQINAVPVIRRRLREKAKKLPVAAHRVTSERFADSIKWHKTDGTIGISGEEATGAEGRRVYEELIRDGLVRDESGALLRLTEEGRRRAEELISEGY